MITLSVVRCVVLIAVQMTASVALPQGDNFQCVAAAAVGLEVGTIPIVRPATTKAGKARERSAVREREKQRSGKGRVERYIEVIGFNSTFVSSLGDPSVELLDNCCSF